MSIYKNLSIVIPFKSGDLIRQTLFDFVYNRLKKLYTDAEIVIGEYDGEPFSRGRAINNGVSKASNENIFICDSDFIFLPKLVDDALGLIDRVPWIIPYSKAYNLDEETTGNIIIKNEDFDLYNTPLIGRPQSHLGLGSMCFIKRDKFDLIGGFDENLVGWGYEDNVFSHIADTVLGEHVRIENKIFHLFHQVYLRRLFFHCLAVLLS